jgi:hypothetical protein
LLNQVVYIPSWLAIGEPSALSSIGPRPKTSFPDALGWLTADGVAVGRGVGTAEGEDDTSGFAVVNEITGMADGCGSAPAGVAPAGVSAMGVVLVAAVPVIEEGVRSGRWEVDTGTDGDGAAPAPDAVREGS